jgi:hypothetical protein
MNYFTYSMTLGAAAGFIGIGLLGEYKYKSEENAGIIMRSIFGASIGASVAPFLPVILPYTIWKGMWSRDGKKFQLSFDKKDDSSKSN